MASTKQTGKNNNVDEVSELSRLFQFFTEVGIINQLSTTAFNQRLPDGMHVSHFSVLNHLIRLGDGQTPVEIARAFQLTKATMSHTLSELGKRQLIELRPNPDDKRSKQVFLLPAGREFRDNAILEMLPYMESLKGKLDFSAIFSALPALQHAREVLDNQRDIDK